MNSLREMMTRILSQPTAPFRESWVNDEIIHVCNEKSIRSHTDDFGNLWVNARSMKEVKAAKVVMVAHTDHPGIVIERFSMKPNGKGKILAHGQWLGGGPKTIVGDKVTVFSHVSSNFSFDGIVISQTNGTRGPDKVVCELSAGSSILANNESFNEFGPWGACLDYTKHGVKNGVSEINGNIHTKAADDLCGVVALITGLLRSKSRNKNVVFLFSRAEECGFHGALDVLEKKIFNPKKTAMISIETSSRLPNAVPGSGPVVRLGDRLSVFDTAFVKWIENTAADVAKKNKQFIFQKKLMDGGACEASAFNCYGFKVAGISTPLVNYHNQFLPLEMLSGKKVKTKTPDGAHPEIVNLADVDKLATLVARIIDTFPANIDQITTPNILKKFKNTLTSNYKKETRKYL